MLFQSIFLYVFLISLLLPIILAGIIFLRKVSSVDKFELLLPVGSILGITFFIFLINSTAFFIKGLNGVVISYLILIITALLLFKKETFLKISYPKGKVLALFIIGLLTWGSLLVWKGNFALIGSDTNLYFAVAHTFIKGNFPPMTPWQPDLPLTYHLGAFELIGAFFAFTGLSFTFLHVFFSTFFIFLSSQIIIWFWKRHQSVFSFVWGNITAAIVFISFGFFKFITPIFPLHMQKINNFHQFFLWVRGLPTVNQAIEVYGAPVNLDALIYFIFHSLGLAISLSLIVIVVHSSRKVFFEWIVLLISLVTLSIINESIFIATAPSLVIVKLYIDFQNKVMLDKKKLILIIFVSLIVLIYQNGFISNNLFSNLKTESSILLFPRDEQVKENFRAYHYYQQISKKHQNQKEWLPFSWYHIGLDLLLVISVLLITFIRISLQQKAVAISLFTSGVFSIAAYNFVVPKFLVANGNRFLAFAFIFLSILVTYLLYSLIDNFKFQKNKFCSIFFIVLSFWLFIPTIIPPLLQLSKTRFGENKLVPKKEEMNESMKWMKANLPYSDRVLVLDSRSPHPSGVARSLTQAGVFSPIFPENIRVYTIEASPEYFDVAYYLSPNALETLKIDTLAIDSTYYKTLPLLRRQQLNDSQLFNVIFSKNFPDGSWEKILKIKQAYFHQSEIDGTFKQLISTQSLSGKIYIDNEENFDPSYLRRAIIFSLRGKDIYYLPQSGVYLNVEVNISSKLPNQEKDYDYLMLSPTTNLKDACNCTAKLIWAGLRDKLYLYQRITN